MTRVFEKAPCKICVHAAVCNFLWLSAVTALCSPLPSCCSETVRHKTGERKVKLKNGEKRETWRENTCPETQTADQRTRWRVQLVCESLETTAWIHFLFILEIITYIIMKNIHSGGLRKILKGNNHPLSFLDISSLPCFYVLLIVWK